MTKHFVIFATLFLVLVPAGTVQCDELAIGRFSQNDISGWEPQEFSGQTRYTLVDYDGRTVLKAEADATASGLSKEIEADPQKFRFLHWSWMVEKSVMKGGKGGKGQDDYAARVYVVFPGTFFWQTKAINYVWAGKADKGDHWLNPFTSNVVMLAVRAGDSRAGVWVKEKRDIYQDYKELFQEDPPEIGAVALMSDGDNTGSKAVAYFGDITLSTR